MLADEFSVTFREEHRLVRDALLNLADAFRAADKPRINELLTTIATLTGPHFRYEEESLYPALVQIFGREYIEELLNAHDGIIASARKLVQLAGQEPLSGEAKDDAVRLVRRILPHVSDCDGLSIMVERLPEAKVANVFQTRERAQAAGLDLFSWADGVRKRPALVG